MPELRNYVGGTVDDPCPTTGVIAWWGGDYCSSADYRAWRTRAGDLFKQAIEPTWKAYADASFTADSDWDQESDPFHVAIEAYRKTWNMLPTPTRIALPDAQRFAVQRAITLLVLGDELVTKMKAATLELGYPPPTTSGTSEDKDWFPDFELPDLPSLPDLSELGWPELPEIKIPWYAWALGGVITIATILGIANAVQKDPKA